MTDLPYQMTDLPYQTYPPGLPALPALPALPDLPAPCAKYRRRGGCRHEQVLLVPNEVVLAVHRQLVVLAHENGADRAGLFAVATEDAARFVNLVNRRVAGTRLHRPIVFGGYEIDCVGRARHRAQPAGDAFLE